MSWYDFLLIGLGYVLGEVLYELAKAWFKRERNFEWHCPEGNCEFEISGNKLPSVMQLAGYHQGSTHRPGRLRE